MAAADFIRDRLLGVKLKAKEVAFVIWKHATKADDCRELQIRSQFVFDDLDARGDLQ